MDLFSRQIYYSIIYIKAFTSKSCFHFQLFRHGELMVFSAFLAWGTNGGIVQYYSAVFSYVIIAEYLSFVDGKKIADVSHF